MVMNPTPQMDPFGTWDCVVPQNLRGPMTSRGKNCAFGKPKFDEPKLD
jgi:hypothetical protein